MDISSQILDGHLFGREQPCFGCSPDHPDGFRLRFEKFESEIRTHFVPRERDQGPVGIMHGGLVSTLADEVAAWAVIGLLEKFGFTVSFEAKFRRAVRIGVPVIASSRIVRNARRLVDVEATIEQAGELAFEGAFRFVILDLHGAEKMLGGPLPEDWKRFCR